MCLVRARSYTREQLQEESRFALSPRLFSQLWLFTRAYVCVQEGLSSTCVRRVACVVSGLQYFGTHCLCKTCARDFV